MVILNLYVSYFLFLGTAKLLSLKLKKWRLLVGSLVGGLFSLIILFDFSVLPQIFIKLLMGVILIITVFPLKGVAFLLKCGGVFAAVNLLYGGFMTALWFFVSPAGMAYKNGVAYFNITTLQLAIATILAYFAVTLFCRLMNRRIKQEEKAELIISFCGRETAVTGLLDTGSKLCDVFSGLPVIVCEYSSVSSVFPEAVKEYFSSQGELSDGFSEKLASLDCVSRLKLIPVTSIGGSSALPAFKPDKILLDGKEKQAIVAVTVNRLSDGDFQAVINPSLI